MKKRVGFVSNSSSSSFIVYGNTDDSDYITVKLRKEALFSEELKTEEDVRKYFKDRYCCQDERFMEDLEMEGQDDVYKDMIERISKGETILMADPEYGEAEMLETILDGSDLTYEREY